MRRQAYEDSGVQFIPALSLDGVVGCTACGGAAALRVVAVDAAPPAEMAREIFDIHRR